MSKSEQAPGASRGKKKQEHPMGWIDPKKPPPAGTVFEIEVATYDQDGGYIGQRSPVLQGIFAHWHNHRGDQYRLRFLGIGVAGDKDEGEIHFEDLVDDVLRSANLSIDEWNSDVVPLVTGVMDPVEEEAADSSSSGLKPEV